MNTVEDIKKAIEKLSGREFARLRAWFDEHEAAHFDQQIASDAASGKLDRLAEQAVADFRRRNH